MGQCQGCGSHHYLEQILSLGYLPPVNDFRPIGSDPKLQSWMPTDVMLCMNCNLVQLKYTAPPRTVFPLEYPYTSGITKSLRDNFADLRHEFESFDILRPTDMIVDIGSNDGTLLKAFYKDYAVVGVEPTDIAKIANQNSVPTVQEFFSPAVANRLNRVYPGVRKHVTCSNCFAHMDKLPEVMEGILELIGDDGVFVSESTYLMSTLSDLSYDTIYHEHLRYYSVTSITHLLRRYGLEVFHVRRTPVNGGSIRVYAARPGVFRDTGYDRTDLHEPVGPYLLACLRTFAAEVSISKHLLMSKMLGFKAAGCSVVGISAPSRAATVINYCRLELDYIAELPASLKMGKYMPGTNIPVVDENVLFGDDQPDVAILFSWHIADEIIPKLRQKGFQGEIVLPCERFQDKVRFVDYKRFGGRYAL